MSLSKSILALGVLGGLMVPVATMAQTIKPEEWAAYRAAYIADDGRLVDTGNGNISHSEGQGYGLILSVLANDRASFERVWSFTQTELMVRSDGLSAWRWEPDAKPHVVDANNATDGDILIAYGLALAGQSWNDPAKTQAATTMIDTIGRTMLAKAGDLTIIMPGQHGFSPEERDDGPVVNPSYWVFEAFPVFAKLTPETDWARVGQDGLKVLQDGRIYPAMLPPDWLSLHDGKAAPATGFPPDFGYNNIRIPIYLLRAGADAKALKPYASIGNDEGIGRVQVTTNSVLERLDEPGYRLIQAAVSCALDGTAIPADLQTMTASSYYGATLQLLLLDYLRREQNTCLNGGPAS